MALDRIPPAAVITGRAGATIKQAIINLGNTGIVYRGYCTVECAVLNRQITVRSVFDRGAACVNRARKCSVLNGQCTIVINGTIASGI